MQSTNGGVV